MPPSFPALTCNYKDNNVFTSARRFYLFAFWFITVCRAPDTWYRSFTERGSLKRVTIIFSSVLDNECLNRNEGGIRFYLPPIRPEMSEQIKSFSFNREWRTPKRFGEPSLKKPHPFPRSAKTNGSNRRYGPRPTRKLFWLEWHSRQK